MMEKASNPRAKCDQFWLANIGPNTIAPVPFSSPFLRTAPDTEKAASRADWCAYTAPVDNKPVTVAMFDHPENARHPASWFTMKTPFAYLSATLNLAKEPMTLTAGKPLRLRYGVALWDGKIEAGQIGRAYQTWVGLHGR